MRSLVRSALLLLVLAGCRNYDAEMPRQDEAQAIVWFEVLRAHEVPGCVPPRILWGDDCVTRDGKPGADDGWGRCVAGFCIISRPSVKRLVWLGSFAESAYAHEHVHAWHWCRGIEDPGHKRVDWKTVEPMARMKLREADL